MRTPRGLERLLLFTDAVVAIAITLLVLPLVDLAPETADVSISTLLSDHGDQLGAFALSFVVIARLWLGALLVSSLALGATGAWVDAHPSLQLDEARDAEPEEPHWTTPILFAAALILNLLIPSLGVWPLLLLLLSGPIDAIRRRRHPAEPGSSI